MGTQQSEPPDAIIFVVDDDDSFRKSLTWLIESMGFEVRAFPSARDFLDGYSDEGPGCLVLDVRMRGMNGVELLELLPDNDINIPVIIMSAYGDVPTAVRAMKAGAVEFLEKPFNDQSLLDLIERAVAKDVERRSGGVDVVRSNRLKLTPRELEVFELIGEGKSNPEIAAAIDIKVRTVAVHRANIMTKMNASSTADLIRMYLLLKLG